MKRQSEIACVGMAFALLISPFAAVAANVARLPQPGAAAFADTEASTNVALSVDVRMMRSVTFAVETDAAPTNSLEVAVGCDADADGDLALEETAFSFGYDCGSWFLKWPDVPPETWSEHRVTGCVERAFVVSRRGYDPEWNIARVIRRGTSAQGRVSVIQDCPGLRFIVR